MSLAIITALGLTACRSPVEASPAPDSGTAPTAEETGGSSPSEDTEDTVADTGPSDPPCEVTGTYATVEAGSIMMCALDISGAVSCWEDRTYRGGPVVSTPTQCVKSIGVGLQAACAITLSDELVCWGSSELYSAIEKVPAGRFKSVDVGSSHACAIDFDDQLTCWGVDGDEGELYEDVCCDAVSGAPTGTFQQTSAYKAHNCALDLDGELHCWASVIA